jgi:NADH:ubiquinone oxidoreductase subunit H
MGPNVVGFFGFLQPIADGFKLAAKETITPGAASTKLFFLIALLSFVVTFLDLSVLT